MMSVATGELNCAAAGAARAAATKRRVWRCRFMVWVSKAGWVAWLGSVRFRRVWRCFEVEVRLTMIVSPSLGGVVNDGSGLIMPPEGPGLGIDPEKLSILGEPEAVYRGA